MRETPARLSGGLRILVDSRVPEGKGVSSSAAVEVATMRAVAALANYDELTGTELGRLCQVAENRVVGAPCGIMDQMTSALGRENELLALLVPAGNRGRLRDDSGGHRVLGHRLGNSTRGVRLGLHVGADRGVHGVSHPGRPRGAGR